MVYVPGDLPPYDFDALLANRSQALNTYSGGESWAVGAAPTDILTFSKGQVYQTTEIRKITVQLFGDTASSGIVPVSVVRRAVNTGGTSSSFGLKKRDFGQPSAITSITKYTAAPSSLGGSAEVLAYAELQVGTNASPAAPYTFDFSRPGFRAPVLRSLGDTASLIYALNLGGVAVPANTRAVVYVELTEHAHRQIVFFGDSLISNATDLQAAVQNVPRLHQDNVVRFFGNNGKRLADTLPWASANTGGLIYPLQTLLTAINPYGVTPIQPIIIEHFLTNDVRQGLITLADAISLLDIFCYIVKNGCTSGQSWTSTKAGGSGTSITFNATLAPRPNARIILWGPNSYLSDDPGATGLIPQSGVFAGMTQAQAAQAATDMVYNAYAAFVGDSRVEAVWQAQDYVSPTTGKSFGRTCKVAASNPLMTDILHPNTDGQYLKTEQAMRGLGYWY